MELLASALALLLGTPSPSPSPSPAAARDGAALYQEHCQRCHGKDGRAPDNYARKGAPDFADPEWQDFRTDEEIRDIVTKGTEGTQMEGFGSDLSRAEIEALVTYVRHWRKPPSP